MSIGKRITECIDKVQAGDPEGALFQICAAIDVTAKNELGKSGRSTYKRFLHENLGLITHIAFGGTKILNVHLSYDHPKVKRNSDGTVAIQEIIYHVVRCGLYHDAALPPDLYFADRAQIRVEDDGRIVLPSALIYGLVIAVVVSPTNRGERAPKEGMLNLGDFPIPINRLWGRRNELLWLLEAISEARRLGLTASQRQIREGIGSSKS